MKSTEIGTFVKRGKWWRWDNQDEGSMVGMIVGPPDKRGWMSVAWIDRNGRLIHWNRYWEHDLRNAYYQKYKVPFLIASIPSDSGLLRLFLLKNQLFESKSSFSISIEKLESFCENPKSITELDGFCISLEEDFITVGCTTGIKMSNVKEILKTMKNL